MKENIGQYDDDILDLAMSGNGLTEAINVVANDLPTDEKKKIYNRIYRRISRMNKTDDNERLIYFGKLPHLDEKELQFCREQMYHRASLRME